MADINHGHGHAPSTLPVESDGVNYRGIVWFIVILTATTLFCQVLVIGFFKLFEYRVAEADTARPALAAPTGTRPEGPVLLTDEPGNLRTFHAKEDVILHTYGWINKDMGTVHIPIDVAKAKVLEKGLPSRPAATTTEKSEREGHAK